MSRGSTADIDPHAWDIVNGKLYLNFNKKIQKKWAKNKLGNINKADNNWLRILNTLKGKY
jgi:hypothetical protein